MTNYLSLILYVREQVKIQFLSSFPFLLYTVMSEILELDIAGNFYQNACFFPSKMTTSQNSNCLWESIGFDEFN